MIKKETEMLSDRSQEKPPQKTFIHYAILKGLDQINTFSHIWQERSTKPLSHKYCSEEVCRGDSE